MGTRGTEGSRNYPSVHHCMFLFPCLKSLCQSTVNPSDVCGSSLQCILNNRVSCWHACMSKWMPHWSRIQPAMFNSPRGMCGTASSCFLYVLQQSQAEAHYKGNRHARRVKGIETSKSRPQEGDKPHTVPPTSSPSPTGASGTAPDIEPSKAGKRAHNTKRRRDRKGSYEFYCESNHFDLREIWAYWFVAIWNGKYAEQQRRLITGALQFIILSCEWFDVDAAELMANSTDLKTICNWKKKVPGLKMLLHFEIIFHDRGSVWMWIWIENTEGVNYKMMSIHIIQDHSWHK